VLKNIKKKGGDSYLASSTHNLIGCLVILFADCRNWASGDAGAAIYASIRITNSFVIFHRKRAYGTYIHAGAAAYAGIFVDLYCHGKTPCLFLTTIYICGY